uniref:UDP-glucuronosyltransferase n=1 Tax=Panagrolaimus sp. PS1159 TaxID=55785 RepID=A0AC35GIA1_9BILA
MTCNAIKSTYYFNVPTNVGKRVFGKMKYGIANMVTNGIRSVIAELSYLGCEILYNDKELMKTIKNQNFSIGFAEYMDGCLSIYFSKIGAKSLVNLNPTALQYSVYRNLGLFLSPSSVPSVDESFSTGDTMNYWQRAWNIYVTFYEEVFYKPMFENVMVYFIAKFFPNQNLSPLDFRKNISLIVTNTNLFLDFAKPSNPKIIHVGGELVNEPKKLQETIKEIYSISTDGVVLISFGTLVDTDKATQIFKDSVKAVVKAYPNLQFIWKTNGQKKNTEFEELKNLHLVTWIDQQSILANPKTKLFFTHCGLNSLNEAAVFGVPMIAMPIFGDQHYNSALINKREIGIAINYLTVTPKELLAVFDEVLKNPKYSQNSKLLSLKIKNNPLKGKYVFLKWIEFVAKYGNSYELDLKSVGMPLWKYYCIDIIIPLICGIGGVIFALFKILLHLFKIFEQLKKAKIE